MARNAGKCPTTPLWKLGPSSLFWPKIGHWEKMRYLFKMISTRPFPIDLALIHLRHNPEGPWHPPDTQQTPNWHLRDGLKCMFFWPKTGHCEKSQYMVKWYLQVCFQWIWHQYTSNTTQSVQDTLQTANRHFQTAINTQFSVFKHAFVCFKLFTTMMYFILEHKICTLLTQFLKAPQVSFNHILAFLTVTCFRPKKHAF